MENSFTKYLQIPEAIKCRLWKYKHVPCDNLRGQQPKRGLEIPNGFQQSFTVLLSPHQDK